MMFEKTVIIPKNLKNQLFNFGEIAESLLFFDKVNLYLKDQNLEALFRTVPIDYLLLLIKQQCYCRPNLLKTNFNHIFMLLLFFIISFQE